MAKRGNIISVKIEKAFLDALKYFAIISIFVTDSFLKNIFPNIVKDDNWNLLLLKLLIVLIISILLLIRNKMKKRIVIHSHSGTIIIEKGDIFKNDGLKLITFDDHLTCEIGEEPNKIKERSICGQYIKQNPEGIKNILNSLDFKMLKMENDGTPIYKTGQVKLYNEEYLFFVFAKLDKDGLAQMTIEEYQKRLNDLWEAISKYKNKDIYIPILGSGITNLDNKLITAQDLLDIMIMSYKLAEDKINKQNTLHIVIKSPNIDLNNIGYAY